MNSDLILTNWKVKTKCFMDSYDTDNTIPYNTRAKSSPNAYTCNKVSVQH